MNVYDVGDLVRLSAAFTISTTPTDPTVLTFRLKPPSGTVQTYVAGVDAQLARDSTGNYHVDWSVTEEGVHYYRFEGVGTAQASEEAAFKVRVSRFYP